MEILIKNIFIIYYCIVQIILLIEVIKFAIEKQEMNIISFAAIIYFIPTIIILLYIE